jgi:3-dehydroquinate synthase
VNNNYKIKTKIKFGFTLPPFSILERGPHFFIVDRRAYQKNPAIKLWLKNADFIYFVTSGEKLKDLNAFPKHMKNIIKITEKLSHRKLTLVAVGGGSLGDFSGFVASTLKRGVRFIQVPTTWLSAIDSAHGGKNALNLNPHKNQIGTFYHPDLVYISRLALQSQSKSQYKDALGELYKMALIEGNSSWAKKIIFSDDINETLLWKSLPFAIKAKYKIVAQDPDESKGIRYILNLGHTIGHVLELELNLTHGNAVSAGLNFVIWYSLRKKLLLNSEWLKLKKSPMIKHFASIKIKPLKRGVLYSALINDKKKESEHIIKFIFLIKPGKVRISPVSISELINEYLNYQKNLLT